MPGQKVDCYHSSAVESGDGALGWELMGEASIVELILSLGTVGYCYV